MSDPNLIRFSEGSPSSGDAAEEMDLLYYIRVIKKYRLLIGGGVFVSVLLAGIVSLLLPRSYEASATVVPVSRSSNSRLSSLISNLGGLADFSGLTEAIPEEGSDLLVNVLESRTLARRVIEKEALLDRLAPSLASGGGRSGGETDAAMEEAVEVLRRDVLSISDSNRGLISVSARHRDPALAARIANAAVEALESFLKENKVSAASRTRVFLSKRIAEVGRDLASAEEALQKFCEENGVISMPDQTRLLFEQIAALSSEVAMKRARKDMLEKLGGASNPEIPRLDAEIDGLQKEILELERGAKRREGPFIQGNGFIPLYNVPEKSLQYTRLLRDVRVRQEVFGYLQTEFETAKIRESCEEIAFTLLDGAVPPQDPVRPKPLLIVSLAGIFSALATFMIASFLEYLARHRANPACAL
ncbi:MAG: GumC family protein [Planctomycetota bacterium]